jgi:AraC-like DNA-binding protein
MQIFAMSGVTLSHPAGYAVENHQHPTGQLSVVLQGTLMVSVEQGWWLVPPGSAFWVPPDVMHRSSYSENSSLVNVHVSASASVRLPPRCEPIVASDLLRELACEVASLSEEDTVEAMEPLPWIFELIAYQVQKQPRGVGLFVPSGTDPRLRRVTARLRADPGCNATISQLAADAGASVRTLSRLFRAETGMSARRWREHLRMVVAVDRLTRGHSIVDTAFGLGYASASSFTSLFTRLLGAPPRRYVLNLRKA